MERDEDRSAQQIGSQGEVTGSLPPNWSLTACAVAQLVTNDLSVWRAWNAIREARNAIRGTRNTIRGTRNTIREARNVIREARNAFREAWNAFREARNALRSSPVFTTSPLYICYLLSLPERSCIMSDRSTLPWQEYRHRLVYPAFSYVPPRWRPGTCQSRVGPVEGHRAWQAEGDTLLSPVT
jgi:hypothetical protein